jgi:hypothetical protein
MKRILERIGAPYALWLALGLLFAIAGVGYDSPDEHFPTLEAAGGLLFGYSSVTWEWEQGLRSWIPPMILAAFLKPFVALGVESRLWLDSIARVFEVLWMLPAIWATKRLAGPDEGERSALWLAGSAWLAVWGTRHGLDTFGIPPLMTGLAIFLTTRRAFAGGVLLGLAFILRFTTALPSVFGVLVALALGRKRFRDCAMAGAGFLAASAILTGFDWRAYEAIRGAGKLPVWEFFRFNVLEGSGRFHASPWHELIVYGLLLSTPPLGWLWSFKLRKREAPRWAARTFAASLVVFSLIRHKELRFVFPLLPFSTLATAALPGPRATCTLVGVNAFLLLTALLLYRDPHGSLVRALDVATREEAPVLWVAGAGGADFPRFYFRRHIETRFISDAEAMAICREARDGVLITREPCGACTLLADVPYSLGYQLRQSVSRTPAARFVYRCGMR